MRKTVLFTIVASVALFVSCSKVSPNEFEQKGVSDKIDLQVVKEEISRLTENHEISRYENKSNVPYPSFLLNPYDSIGALHNYLLNQYHSNPSYSVTASFNTLADIINTENQAYFNEIIITNPALAEHSLIEQLYDNIHTEDGFVDPLYWSTLNVPILEQQTLSLYFSSVLSTNETELRVEMSKVIEAHVVGNPAYETSSQTRLLQVFAIFRYSTVYWADYLGDTDLPSPNSFNPELLDAAVAEMCMDGTISHPDGWDISCPGNNYARNLAAAVSFLGNVKF